MRLTTNFSLSEFRCNDKAKTPVPTELIPNCKRLAVNLQILRYRLSAGSTYPVKIKVVSGYRTLEHNAAEGGEDGSLHLKALAADIKCYFNAAEGGEPDNWVQISPDVVYQAILYCIKEGTMTEGGVGKYPTFTHYDPRGTKARWTGRSKKP